MSFDCLDYVKATRRRCAIATKSFWNENSKDSGFENERGWKSSQLIEIKKCETGIGDSFWHD